MKGGFLTFGDTVFCRQQPLLHQTLEHRTDRWTMNKLHDEQVRLDMNRIESRLGNVLTLRQSSQR